MQQTSLTQADFHLFYGIGTAETIEHSAIVSFPQSSKQIS
jgi:hypothetical protein